MRQLIDLGNVLLLCPSVQEELRRPETRRRADAFDGFSRSPAEPPDVIARLKARHPRLGSGELEVLAMGLRMKAGGLEFLLVLDDWRARETAAELGLARTGAVGIIRLLEGAGCIDRDTAAARILALKAGGFRYEEP